VKKIAVLLLVLMTAVPVFARDNGDGEKKIAITMNPGPLIIGTILGGFGMNIGVETAILKWLSVKGNLYYIGFDPIKFAGYDEIDGAGYSSNVSLFRANAEVRWYP
jgi:hypothetical protein